MFSFMFATGIENSCPTIKGGKVRVDELEKCGFYKHWKTDFDLIEELGIRFLRFGPSILHTWLGPGKYDWEMADEHFAELRRRDIVPIVDWEVDDKADPKQKWVKIRFQGRDAFVPEEQIRSPIEQAACFVKSANGWRMTAFAPAGGE